MTETEFRNLAPGDLVQQEPRGETFVVVKRRGENVVAVRTMAIKIDGWTLVAKSKPVRRDR